MSNFVRVDNYNGDQCTFVHKRNISSIWIDPKFKDRAVICMNNRDDAIVAKNPYKTIEEFVAKFEDN